MATRQSFIVAAALAISSTSAPAQSIDPKVQARIDRILKATPLIDGHNDLAWELRDKYGSHVEGLEPDNHKPANPLITDMARVHEGRVGAQFWSVFITGEVTGDAAVRETVEQIDVVK